MEIPSRILMDDELLRLVEVLPHGAANVKASDARNIVVYEDARGQRGYLFLDEWDRLAQICWANIYRADDGDDALGAGYARVKGGVQTPQPNPKGSGGGASAVPVTASSSNHEKLALFRSLFQGRPDVHAHGYRRRDGGISYTPACDNEWKSGICLKGPGRSVKCAACAKRAFSPLDDRALLRHFAGKSERFEDVVGIYVLDESCTTAVLVADFDGGRWQEEVMAYVASARKLGVDVAVERSRSGAGAHVWIFFSNRVPADLARQLGFIIIGRAQERSAALPFAAFDRLFPAQNTIPAGGFGNLVALPFQGRARRAGNSVFVDDTFRPFDDQWAALSAVRKVTASQVVEIVRRHHDNIALDPLGATAGDAEKGEPARLPVPEVSSTLDPGAGEQGAVSTLSLTFPETLAVTLTGELCVPKAGISPAVLYRIRRLAVLANPAFYQAQAMRRSVRRIARYLTLFEEDGESIVLPRGCLPQLENLCAMSGCELSIEDRRYVGSPIRVVFAGILRGRQQEALDALLAHENGILSAPTGFGKTVVAAALIARLGVRTLVVVPSTALLNQWREKLKRFLDIDEEPHVARTPTGRPRKHQPGCVGCMGSGEMLRSGIIDVATYQSLFVRDDDTGEVRVRGIVRSYGMVICDECHHAAAPQLERVLRAVSARYIYGFSATPRRSDHLERIIYLLCGPVRFSISAREQASEQDFVRRLIPRFTRIRLNDLEPGMAYSQILDRLEAHRARNRLIVDDVAVAVGAGRHALVVTRRAAHAHALADAIGARGVRTLVLTGKRPAREKRLALEKVAKLPDGEPWCLVATGAYIGEGFDEPRLDTLFLAAPYSWDGVISQYAGRLHRESAGKTDVVVYDYVDLTVPMLDRMYQRRLKAFARLGYIVGCVSLGADGTLASSELSQNDGQGDETVHSADAQGRTSPACEFGAAEIIDAAGFRLALLNDIDRASRSVTLFAPYATERFVATIRNLLVEAVGRGVVVSIRIRPPRDAAARSLTAHLLNQLCAWGTKATFDDEIAGAAVCGIAIFDARYVWYGSLPLLAFPKRDACSLRLDSSEIAHDLLQELRLAGEKAIPDGCRWLSDDDSSEAPVTGDVL